MLTNEQIEKLLKKNHGDLSNFARFIGISNVALYKRLKSKLVKNNLDGVYKEFLLKQKGKQ